MWLAWFSGQAVMPVVSDTLICSANVFNFPPPPPPPPPQPLVPSSPPLSWLLLGFAYGSVWRPFHWWNAAKTSSDGLQHLGACKGVDSMLVCLEAVSKELESHPDCQAYASRHERSPAQYAFSRCSPDNYWVTSDSSSQSLCLPRVEVLDQSASAR